MYDDKKLVLRQEKFAEEYTLPNHILLSLMADDPDDDSLTLKFTPVFFDIIEKLSLNHAVMYKVQYANIPKKRWFNSHDRNINFPIDALKYDLAKSKLEGTFVADIETETGKTLCIVQQKFNSFIFEKTNMKMFNSLTVGYGVDIYEDEIIELLQNSEDIVISFSKKPKILSFLVGGYEPRLELSFDKSFLSFEYISKKIYEILKEYDLHLEVK